jgi:hypothetical protein
VLGWRTFVELEATHGQDAPIHLELPRRAATASVTLSRRHPLVLLALKELRLQQLAWSLAVVYALLYIGLILWRRGTADADTLAQVLTMFFTGAIAIVLGAVTTAEERQLGTHEGQLMQPLPTWQGWFVKAGMALGSAGILTILLPVVLITLLPIEHVRAFARGGLLSPQFIWSLAMIVAISTYVSALSPTTVRSLVATIAVLVAVAVFFQRVVMVAVERAWQASHIAGARRFYFAPWLTRRQEDAYWYLFFAALLFIIFRLAGSNQRRADRGLVRLSLQVGAIAVVTVAGFALAGALGIR